MAAPTVNIDLRAELDELAPLVPSDRLLWTPRQLHDLTSTITENHDKALRDLLRFDARQRWWLRLGLTRGVEIWLLSWLPGQHTEPHDHGGAVGSFSVLLGNVFEEFRYPTKEIRQRVHATGSTCSFGAGRAHQVRNRSLAPAATVHAYSPPLVPTREYASLHDVPAYIPPLPAPSSFARVLADTTEP